MPETHIIAISRHIPKTLCAKISTHAKVRISAFHAIDIWLCSRRPKCASKNSKPTKPAVQHYTCKAYKNLSQGLKAYELCSIKDAILALGERCWCREYTYEHCPDMKSFLTKPTLRSNSTQAKHINSLKRARKHTSSAQRCSVCLFVWPTLMLHICMREQYGETICVCDMSVTHFLKTSGTMVRNTMTFSNRWLHKFT